MFERGLKDVTGCIELKLTQWLYKLNGMHAEST